MAVISRRRDADMGLLSRLDTTTAAFDVHRSVEQHGGAQACQAQAGGEGGGLPMAVGNGGPAACPALGAASQASHLGRGAGLIDEDQLLGVEIGLGVQPGLAAEDDIRPLLLGGVRGFF